MNKKLSCRNINANIRDEKEAVARYTRQGFPKLAAQEQKHADFFRELKKKRCH